MSLLKFPRAVFHKDGRRKVVFNEAELNALDSTEWTGTAFQPDLSIPRRDQYQFHEYPRMVYHDGLEKIVHSKEEEAGLGKEWSRTPPKAAPAWKAKAKAPNKTKCGFEVKEPHLEFLRANGIELADVQAAALYINALTEEEQVQFFTEAANWVPEPVKGKK